jgi:hypothetical protein
MSNWVKYFNAHLRVWMLNVGTSMNMQVPMMINQPLLTAMPRSRENCQLREIPRSGRETLAIEPRLDA